MTYENQALTLILLVGVEFHPAGVFGLPFPQKQHPISLKLPTVNLYYRCITLPKKISIGYQEGHLIALFFEAPPLKQMFYIKPIGFSYVILLCILQLIFDFKQRYHDLRSILLANF